MLDEAKSKTVQKAEEGDQNAILLVDAINWDIIYKDLISKMVCDSTRKECMMHQCESCPGRAGLKPFLDKQLSDVD